MKQHQTQPNQTPSILPPEQPFVELDAEKSGFRGEEQKEFLERYIYYSDKLIEKIQDFEKVDGESVPADVVIFLDKSARPLSWMLGDLWPLLAQPETDEHGQKHIPAIPSRKFLNIDRLPWRKDKATEITTHPSNMRQPDQKDIEGLRAIFNTHKAKDGESILDVPSPLDGKRILVVDEVGDSGDTLYVATHLVEQAFPTSTIKGHTWMNVYTHEGGVKQVRDVPVWYNSNSDIGRGVHGQVSARGIGANKSSRLTEESHQFLSTRPIIAPNDNTSNSTGHTTGRVSATLKGIDSDGFKTGSLGDRLKTAGFSTVDEKGRRLREEMGRMAGMLATLDLVPPLNNFNGADEITYEAARLARLEEKNAARSLFAL